ncbi:MAG: hypothetical protein OXC19_14900 [Bryobacterales bacterium]|nr:hypothetical protein [Bryobacterales bacterium]
MSEPSYDDLEYEKTWMDYLRTRLPYSFNRVEEKGSGRSRYFELSKPVLLTGFSAAEHHNFWRRGQIYYVSGKLLDYYTMPQIGQSYRTAEVAGLLTDSGIARILWPSNPFAFYNSMQMEKVWGFAQANHLDRERVMMTNVILALELCLKAVSTHASFRETRSFRFNAGHDVAKLYAALPDSLRDEIVAESEAFAKEYVAFRAKVEADVGQLFDQRLSPSDAQPNRKEQAEAEWNELARRINESSYTAFVGSNDPGQGNKYLHEGWLEEALSQVESIVEPGDISQYFRYAPHKDKDALPVDLIHWILLLGRFMYEHLFPVPPTDTHGPHSGFPIPV